MTLPGRLSALLPAAALALLALLLALFAGAGSAQEVQPVPALAGRVIDATGTLTPEQVRALDERLAALERQRGSQVVVLIVASTQPEDIAAYAQRVADHWKIGRREVGDGVLVVVAKDDRKVRIEVAKALEGAIPDLAASRIIEQTIVPAFRAGDFPGGLNAAVGRIAERIGSEAANEGLPAPAPRRQGGGGAKQASGGFDLQDLAIFLFVGVPVVGAMLTGIFGRKLGALATGGVVGGLGWWLTASLLAAAGAGLLSLLLVGVLGVGSGRRGRGGFLPGVVLGGLGGRGGFGGGRGGGGGFSSGGGGNFGGGGASGGW